VDETASPDVTYDYYYNESWQMLEVRRTPAGGSEIVYKQYVWDIRYIDAPVLRWRDADKDGSSLEETLYYTNDANMNVTAVVDTSGDMVERYAYDPYGRPIFVNGENGADPDVDGETVFEWQPDADGVSDVDNCILYCGYRYDAETGLYDVRYRTYHPTLGRWMQRDPVGHAHAIKATPTRRGTSAEHPDGENLYQYAVSAPGGHTDASGLKCVGGVVKIVRVWLSRIQKNACDCQDCCDEAHAAHGQSVRGFWSFLKYLLTHRERHKACYAGCTGKPCRARY